MQDLETVFEGAFGGLAQATIYTYKRRVLALNEWLKERDKDIFSFSRQDLDAFFEECLEKGLKSNNYYQQFAAIAKITRYLHTQGLIDSDPCAGISQVEYLGKIEKNTSAKIMGPNAVTSLFDRNFLDESFSAKRNRALLGTIFFMAANSREVADLTFGDVGQHNLMLGKRSALNERKLPIPDELRAMLDAHMGRDLVSDSQPVFTPSQERYGGQPIAPKSIRRLFDKCLKNAGLGLEYSPGSLRLAGIARWIAQGKDALEIQGLTGLKSYASARELFERASAVTFPADFSLGFASEKKETPGLPEPLSVSAPENPDADLPADTDETASLPCNDHAPDLRKGFRAQPLRRTDDTGVASGPR